MGQNTSAAFRWREAAWNTGSMVISTNARREGKSMTAATCQAGSDGPIITWSTIVLNATRPPKLVRTRPAVALYLSKASWPET